MLRLCAFVNVNEQESWIKNPTAMKRLNAMYEMILQLYDISQMKHKILNSKRNQKGLKNESTKHVINDGLYMNKCDNVCND